MKDNRSNTTQETLKLLEEGIKSLVNSDTYKCLASTTILSETVS